MENPPLDSPIMADEIFGPLLPIITVRDVNTAADLINDKPKPLAVYVFSSNKDYIKKFTKETSSGSLVVNECVFQVIVTNLPFDGVGEVGTGTYHGKATFDTFSQKKAVLAKSMGGDVSARYPPYTAMKQSLLKTLLAGRILDLLLLVMGLKKAIDHNH